MDMVIEHILAIAPLKNKLLYVLHVRVKLLSDTDQIFNSLLLIDFT